MSGLGSSYLDGPVGQNPAIGTATSPVQGVVRDWGGEVWNALSPTNPSGAAVGDGAANDQAPIATTLSTATGGCAEFPGSKIYLFNTQLNAANSEQLQGTSRGGSVLKQANGSNLAQALTAGTGHVHFRDFTLDGNKANNATANNGLMLWNPNCSAENVRVLNSNGRSFAIFSSGISVIACHSEGSGSFATGAIYWNGASMFRVIGNRVDTPALIGMTGQPGALSSLAAIVANTILNSGAEGIAFAGSVASAASSLMSTVANIISKSDIAFHCLDHGGALDMTTTANIFNGGLASTSIDTAQRIAFVANVSRGANAQGLQIYNTTTNSGTQVSGRDMAIGMNVWTDCGQVACDIDSTSYLTIVGNIGKGSRLAGQAAFDIHKNNAAVPNRILLLGNIGYDDKTVKTQLYGLRTSAAVASVVAAHNDFRGNLTGAVLDNGPDTYMHGNFGYNPRGAIAPPGVPATTVILQNPFNVDCTVYIAGGTLTAIGVGGLPAPANWATQPTLTTATTGGTLAQSTTYAYRVAARNAAGHTGECTEVTIAIGAVGNTNTVTVTLPTGGLRGVTGWDIYGRTSGAELLMATNWQLPTFTDDGSIAPAGAMPGTDTTGNTATGITAAAPAGAVHTVRVMYAQGVKLTYTVAPTWTWFGD